MNGRSIIDNLGPAGAWTDQARRFAVSSTWKIEHPEYYLLSLGLIL